MTTTSTYQTRHEPAPAQATPARLRAEGVRLAYGDLVVPDDLDFDVLGGTITAVIGPNGCGNQRCCVPWVG